MNSTPIEWTDFTVNPFRFRNLETGKVGHHCTKISPGCKHCYSSKMQSGPYLSGLQFIEENKAKGEFFLDESVLQQVLRRKKPARIFWCDMTDMFLRDYPDEWIDKCFAVMALTPHLTHQVLTKRADRMLEYFSGETSPYFMACTRVEQIARAIEDWPLPNVWLGVSVEDQQRKDRLALLRETPAAVRFVSFEPLLEDLGVIDLSGIDLAIWGGESGPGARSCDLAWIRNGMKQAERDECKNFVKQLGAYVVDRNDAGFEGDTPQSWPMDTAWSELDSGYQGAPVRVLLDNPKGGEIAEWPRNLRVRQMPEVTQ